MDHSPIQCQFTLQAAAMHTYSQFIKIVTTKCPQPIDYHQPWKKELCLSGIQTRLHPRLPGLELRMNAFLCFNMSMRCNRPLHWSSEVNTHSQKKMHIGVCVSCRAKGIYSMFTTVMQPTVLQNSTLCIHRDNIRRCYEQFIIFPANLEYCTSVYLFNELQGCSGFLIKYVYGTYEIHLILNHRN